MKKGENMPENHFHESLEAEKEERENDEPHKLTVPVSRKRIEQDLNLTL